MGPSGSGKSTLMHVLAGLDQPTSGVVTLDGVEISALEDNELTQLRREKVGFIFQSFNLLPGPRPRGRTSSCRCRSPAATPTATGSSASSTPSASATGCSHRPSELSGGQQQRVAVARALASRPAVVFADEPTGNLDSKSGHDVLDLLRRSVDDFGQTIVMVTHDANAAVGRPTGC